MNSRSTWRSCALLLAAFIVSPASAYAQDESPLKAIRDKDPATRAAAAEALGKEAGAKAEAALIKAVTKDEDVLVLLACLEALGQGERGERTTKALVEVALESPYHRVRLRAAETAADVNAEEALEQLGKKLSGKTFAAAAEAMTAVQSKAAPSLDEKETKGLLKRAAKGLSSKDEAQVPFAAGALMALSRGTPELRAEWRATLVENAETKGSAVAITCAALEAIAAAPAPSDGQLTALLGTKLQDVVERRLEAALSAVFGTLTGEARAGTLAPLLKDPVDPAGPRLARISAAAGWTESERLTFLKELMTNGDAATKTAAAHQLRFLGKAGAEAALGAIASAEGAPLELQLVRVLEESGEVVSGNDAKEPGSACRPLLHLLAKGASPGVREAAARALGRPGLDPAARAELERAAARGDDIGFRTVATIALGRVRDTAGTATLQKVAEHADWRLRAAAAEGLKQLSAEPSIAPLIQLLGDEHSAVRATAHQALLRLSGREGETIDPKTWDPWWKENLKKAKFETLEESKARREKYGYGIDETRIYRGLDVVVIPGRGDHIEGVLERLGIQFRTARAGNLDEAGLHPGAILLVGCTGEIAAGDIEVVRWYVRSGGALFTSCWALTYTLEASFPSILTKSPTPGEVLDNVFARPTASALRSPYLRGVFDGGVQPYYSLQGAHLISVVDPERAEVLLDSPEAAARHGSGVLAAWFRMGHGAVLNSANHFAEQGFSAARGLKKPIHRQAFAVNHMGLSPVQLRAMMDESWWSSTAKTAAEISDLSVFRILTNFVREKRIRG